MTVIDPSTLIDQAVHYFLNQWYLGLQPSMTINTSYDGTIFVCSKVKRYEQQYQYPLFRRRRSGRKSRQRRVLERSQPCDPILSSDAQSTAFKATVRKLELGKSQRGMSTPTKENVVVQLNTVTKDDNQPYEAKPTESELPCSILESIEVTRSDAAVQTFQVKLNAASQVSVDVLPKTHNLSFANTASISIPPRQIFHPAIIKASLSMHGKHPSELSQREIVKFNQYLRWKSDIGERVEEDIIYLPSSMRNCLHCGHPT